MEHIGHFPCSLGGVAFDCVGQSIHTGRSGQALWHGGHHIGINDCDDRHVVGVNAYEFALALYVGDNVVDGNLCSGAGSGRNGDNRNAGLFGGSNAFEAADVFKFLVGDDDADGLGGIHRGTAADCDDVVSAGSLERCNAVLYVFDGRVCFDIGVDFISKTFAV